tara:strand:- start:198 stop:737 length:540 start_codon:yes stop_codon:yes gene_type:complete
MTTAKKIEQVELLKDLIDRAEIAIAMTYQGTTVADQVELRDQLRQADAEVRVVKNTLFKRAAVDAGREEFAQLVDGPTALVFGYADPVAPAKALQNYIAEAENEFVHVKQAVVSGQLVDSSYISDLATVPPKEELVARIAGGLIGKVRELMLLLDATTRDFSGLIEARAAQLEAENKEN